MVIRNMRIFILFVAFMPPSIALALTEAECEDVYIDSMGLAWFQEGGELLSGIEKLKVFPEIGLPVQRLPEPKK